MALASLKIALICDHFLPRIGGIELQVRDLAIHLARKGHRPHILTTTAGLKNLADFTDLFIPVHVLEAKLLPNFKILYRPKDLIPLAKKLREEQYDLIHSHISVVSPLAYAALKIAHDLKTPSVMTAHSLLERSQTLLKLLWKYYQGPKWHWMPTAVSTTLAEGVQKIVGNHEVKVLPNGIDLSHWSIQKKTDQDLNVISVLRLNKKKRPQALIRQIPKILSQIQNPASIKFHFVGKGPYEKKLKNLTQNLQLNKYVHFHGYLTRAQIRQLFASCDLFVLPTKKEAFGIVLLEARASGLPTVALSYGGPRDLIHHEENGILAPNDKAMANAIAALLNNSERRNDMAKKSRAGLEKYEWNEVIKDHEQIYIQLLERNES